ncbi:uncharacterized protein LOC121316583 isoform X2 [Polyodon spathula]|uniref:uncharacterized protein LOC121316583 isoform X2 n=1 Tax=Polyodon spathula TaxID=7913 RepID=UPI001B7DD557|nr:uncharacterized protein LOC121316583 isoform X2 [Polyodon spathula]
MGKLYIKLLQNPQRQRNRITINMMKSAIRLLAVLVLYAANVTTTPIPDAVTVSIDPTIGDDNLETYVPDAVTDTTIGDYDSSETYVPDAITVSIDPTIGDDNLETYVPDAVTDTTIGDYDNSETYVPDAITVSIDPTIGDDNLETYVPDAITDTTIGDYDNSETQQLGIMTTLSMITMTLDPLIMTQHLNKQHDHHQEHPVRADTSQVHKDYVTTPELKEVNK